ncbi:DUF6883 domain-containing protein [Gracilimonas mengyeensis]|uniref:DUF6883 domain-containing protein n=1 Tax=Gracilimonas mengyeensis TaxID=1302730 RepID=A0A521D7A3_9BACT|nr:DUF6883 domain-containing protein [Gracilimonas mengyeensis]SMO66780.1 hypothetical protein SAMN06265219_107122 [Gracilimonas mengyeensis]
MLLPNYQNAIIPDEKLRNYCLDFDHRTGKHKAILFQSILNFEKKDYKELKKLILEGVSMHEAVLRNKDRFGKRYFVDISLNEIYSHILRTAWIIKNEEENPILTTCYLKQKP